MSFFIERSGDEYGNRGLPAAVIEAEVINEHKLRILAPSTIAKK